MGWKILCSLSVYKAEDLKAKFASYVAGATANYVHAFLLTSEKKDFAVTDKDLTFSEYSGQAFNIQALREPLVAGSVDGYVQWKDRVAVVVDAGPEDIGALLSTYGKDFAAKAKAAAGKRYPADCLGYCVTVVKKTSGRATVAGHSDGL